MIGKLTGFIDVVGEDFIILDVNGVGYKIFCSSKVLSKIQNSDKKISLWIETVVREDAITLFGFSTTEEQECFNTLCKVSGVGTKVALKIMNVADTSEIISAIISEDSKVFCRASGVGSKVAVRIINELKHSSFVKNFGIGDINISVKTDSNLNEDSGEINNKKIINDAVLALEGLGYQKSTVHTIVIKIVSEKPYLTLESVITESLKKINNF